MTALPDRANEPLVLAVPKGRILDELRPVMRHAGIEPEPAFDDPRHRGLRFRTNHPGIDVSPACGGPGGLIAFVSSRHGSPQIFTMNSSGGAVTRVTYRGSHNQTPAWCPRSDDGPLLAFTGRSGDFDIFTVNLRTQQYTRLTQGQGSNKDPAFSPDCRMVAFYSSRGGIYLASPEGLNQNLVVPGHAETLRWSR